MFPEEIACHTWSFVRATSRRWKASTSLHSTVILVKKSTIRSPRRPGEWIERQKMLLNEYRLQPWTREAQEFLVEQMQEYFFGEGSALPKEYVPPAH